MTTRLRHRTAFLLSLAVGCCSYQGCGSDETRATPLDGGERSDSGGEHVDNDNNDATLVTVAAGKLSGAKDEDVYEFLGIPYAKPPIGALRWKPPQQVDSWSGTRAATEYGKRCAQVANPTFQMAGSDDEDCLYLNVWTPDTKPKKKLAVMVWIYGGSNRGGSTNEPLQFSTSGLLYLGKFLAHKDVVVVSMNYRAGVFGFFAHAALGAESGGVAANQGLWDQRAALQWVQRNIDKFGGDPDNVTLFGQSSGSLDTCLHVASPQSRGLFHKAISESAGCTTRQTLKSEAEMDADNFAKAIGCQGSDALSCLRSKSVAELLTTAASDAFGKSFGPPVVDGEFLPDQPRVLYDAGAIAKIPYLLGSNSDEGTLSSSPVMTADDLTRALIMFAGSESSASFVASYYPPDKFMDAKPNPYQAVLDRVLGDATIVCTTYDAAVRSAKAGAPAVYMYNFDVPLVRPDVRPYLGASHGSEIAYVFGTSDSFNDDSRMVSDRMQRYWTNFAKTGDPNGESDDLVWPKFSEDDNVRINLALTTTTIATDFRAHECAFWRVAYDDMFEMP